MNREDWIWVAIRVFGIYLLVLAVVALPGVLLFGTQAIFSRGLWHSSPTMTATSQASNTPDATMDMAALVAHANAMSRLVGSLGEVILFSLIGYYLVRRGNWLFKIISRRQPW